MYVYIYIYTYAICVYPKCMTSEQQMCTTIVYGGRDPYSSRLTAMAP